MMPTLLRTPSINCWTLCSFWWELRYKSVLWDRWRQNITLISTNESPLTEGSYTPTVSVRPDQRLIGLSQSVPPTGSLLGSPPITARYAQQPPSPWRNQVINHNNRPNYKLLRCLFRGAFTRLCINNHHINKVVFTNSTKLIRLTWLIIFCKNN